MSLATLFERDRSRAVLVLAGPIIAGMMSQTVLNLIDTAMVGRLGPAAQGAAGLGSFSFFVLANLVIGLGTGVQAMVSRRDGEGAPEKAGAALDTALMLAVFVALPLGFALSFTADRIFPFLSDDAAVVSGGSGYLQIRLMAVGVVTANYCFRGFFNGIGRSRTYMSTLIVIHVLNVVLNWVFIYGNLGAPRMEVRGAALASALAAAIGTLTYVILTVSNKEVRSKYLPFRFGSLSGGVARGLVSLSWPEALRGIGLMVGFLIFLRMHSWIGTREVAAGTILVNLASVGFLPALGFGLAGATFVGRNLGAKKPAEARRMVWQTWRIAFAAVLLPIVLMQAAPAAVLAAFTPDRVVIELAVPAVRLLALSFLVDTLAFVLIYSLVGAGATRWAAAVQLGGQYVVLLPLAWLLGLQLDLGLVGLWTGMVLSRAVLAALGWQRFRGDSWERIEV